MVKKFKIFIFRVKTLQPCYSWQNKAAKIISKQNKILWQRNCHHSGQYQSGYAVKNQSSIQGNRFKEQDCVQNIILVILKQSIMILMSFFRRKSFLFFFFLTWRSKSRENYCGFIRSFWCIFFEIKKWRNHFKIQKFCRICGGVDLVWGDVDLSWGWSIRRDVKSGYWW